MLKRVIKREHGVITLETGIVLPIFIMLLLFFYGIIIMFLGDQAITHALSQTAQSLSLDSYASNMVDYSKIERAEDLAQALYSNLFDSDEYFSSNEKWYDEGGDALLETVENRFVGYLSGGRTTPKTYADDLLEYVGVVNGLEGFDFSATNVTDNVLTITVKYQQEFLFDFHGLASFDKEYVISVKMW